MADPKGVSPKDAALMAAAIDDEHRKKAAQDAADKVCGEKMEGFATWLMDNAKNHPQAAAAFLAKQPEFTGTFSVHVDEQGPAQEYAGTLVVNGNDQLPSPDSKVGPPLTVSPDYITDQYGVLEAAKAVIDSRYDACVDHELKHPSSEMTAANTASSPQKQR